MGPTIIGAPHRGQAIRRGGSSRGLSRCPAAVATVAVASNLRASATRVARQGFASNGEPKLLRVDRIEGWLQRIESLQAAA